MVRWLVALFLLFVALPIVAQDAKTGPPKFESNILPLLKSRCASCHDDKVKQAGLSVLDRDALVKGGKTGAAIVPGKPVDSLILSLLSSGKMPMGGQRFSPGEIDLIRSWIESGALKEGETETKRTVTESEALSSILGAKCFVCHGRRKKEADLDLRTRASMLKGGKSGPAIVLGKPDESLLIRKIGSQTMPPPKLQEQFSVRGVTSEELERLRLWISSGGPADTEKPIAVNEDADPAVSAKDRSFWAFQPPVKAAIPAVKDSGRVRNPIDAFLLAALEKKAITFNEDADRRTLLRRAYFDLTGLPPTSADVDAFVKDPDPKAYEKLIDRLLASPNYGERWARFWLEGVGYADSEGGTNADEPRPYAWRYRDYVIRSLNADKPYDRFLTEQIAGDELFDYAVPAEYTPEQVELLAATGFWRMGPDSTYSTEQNFFPDRLDVIAGQVEILGSSVLGLSVGCARCHDHKYDPIPTRDYYRLSAILHPAYDVYSWLSPNPNCAGVGAKCDDTTIRYLPLNVKSEQEFVRTHNAPIELRIKELQAQLEERTNTERLKLQIEKLKDLPTELREDARAALEKAEKDRTDVEKFLLKRFDSVLAISPGELDQKFPEFAQAKLALNKEIAAEKEKLKPVPRIRALFDLGAEPPPSRILLRGEYTNPGPLVEPGVLSAVHDGIKPYVVEKPAYKSGTSGRRLALAKWLAQPQHPLTARVLVNRVWQQHFGSGLITTPGNFGKMGAPPSNPQLLDWLATEFTQKGWSMKTLHRLIMTSTAYRQNSRIIPERQAQDPDGSLLSRFPMRRLDSDAIRDSILAVSGRLDPQTFGPPVPIKVMPDGEVIGDPSKKTERRTIYLTNRRTRPVSMLETFDAPFLNPNCVKRAQSVVASQALQLMNSDMVRESSRFMAGRIIDKAGQDRKAQIEAVYFAALARRPSPEELRASEAALVAMNSEWLKTLQSEKPAEPLEPRASWLGLATLCHTIMNSAEFLYIQ